MPETFYITTPIYYPSGKLHIGNSYCTVAVDTMARYKRMRGYDVFFLTGTDEHGQKIERKAKEAGKTPIQYVDEIVAGILDLWKLMDIDYSDFIRTTEPRHEKVVQQIFKQLYDQGDIYKGAYEGWYCTPCESFWTETQLVDGKCPDCGRAVEKTQEEAYFFKLSKYAGWLLDYIKSHSDFIVPQSRANEMIKNFIEPGLEDLCVSRTSFKWGVPVTFDPDHVVYVWIDALSNYITALGYGSDDDSLYQKYWPADIHVIGKDILRFHTIIWPIILHALGLPLPKQIYGTGWLVLEGGKMSKSKGNVIDPVVLVTRYGLDAIRYFLMREMPLGSDGLFTNEGLINRINSDLANDLGNLLNRTVAMIQKYFGGTIPAMGPLEDVDKDLGQMALGMKKTAEENMDAMEFSAALSEIWTLIRRSNKYIDETMPWILAKDESEKERLGTVMYHLAETLRFVSVLISPVMTKAPSLIRGQLGLSEDEAYAGWESLGSFGAIPEGTKVGRAEPLFPRMDVEKELAELESLIPGGGKEQKKSAVTVERKPEINFDDFTKVQLRAATVTAAEKVEKSNKLLKLSLSLGDETRQVVSGIAKYYSADEMVGKQVVLVANLKPAKLMGIVSQGMILCAEDDEGNLKLIMPEGAMPDGAEIS